MQAIFHGVGVAVVGIIATSAYKLMTKTVGHDMLLRAIFLSLATMTFIPESEIAWLFIVVGLIGCRVPPASDIDGYTIAMREIEKDLRKTKRHFMCGFIEIEHCK
ncbi:chromate ion transporter ChrA domain protein [Burkholderia oklahomensis]|uniref:Chromate ion transporter ChrA domain protein n=1 Tax=Burkholderia oklahomensis TaxID=342113 RepID=A0AAI8BAC2_9BURK|nr:chromate ion transporter ChrA domain protein [Burkholderia oklahomensis]